MRETDTTAASTVTTSASAERAKHSHRNPDEPVLHTLLQSSPPMSACWRLGIKSACVRSLLVRYSYIAASI